MCSGPNVPPATSQSPVEYAPAARAYTLTPSGEGGSRVSSAHSTAPKGSSPVPGPVG